MFENNFDKILILLLCRLLKFVVECGMASLLPLVADRCKNTHCNSLQVPVGVFRPPASGGDNELITAGGKEDAAPENLIEQATQT